MISSLDFHAHTPALVLGKASRGTTNLAPGDSGKLQSLCGRSLFEIMQKGNNAARPDPNKSGTDRARVFGAKQVRGAVISGNVFEEERVRRGGHRIQLRAAWTGSSNAGKSRLCMVRQKSRKSHEIRSFLTIAEE